MKRLLLKDKSAIGKRGLPADLCSKLTQVHRAPISLLGISVAAGLLLSVAAAPCLAHAEIADMSFAHSTPEHVNAGPAEDSGTSNTEPAAVAAEVSAPPVLLKYLEEQKCPDVASTAMLLMEGIDIARAAGFDTPDPLLLACLAKPESKFNDGAVGSAGERGLLQVHPCHKRSMTRMGLDFNSGADRVAYACVLWDSSGLKPWTTRRTAQRDYSRWSEKYRASTSL